MKLQITKKPAVYNTAKKETGCDGGRASCVVMAAASENYDGTTPAVHAAHRPGVTACSIFEITLASRKVASSKHVSTRSLAWIASMSLHREDLGHATDCAEYAEGSRRDTAVAAAMPAAVDALAGGLRA